MEKEHPELTEKAKKYLGYELYYELTKEAGKQLTPENPLYNTLMQMSDELNKQYHKEIS